MNNAGFAFNKFIATLTQCVFGFHILEVTFNSCFHNLLSLPGTGPGRRVISLTRYKGKDKFYISKHFSLNFAKKFCFVLNPWIPSDRSGRQRLFKRGVGRTVLAQFEPMFEFGPLDHNPANPVRVPGNISVNLICHLSPCIWLSSFAIVQSFVSVHQQRFVRRTYMQVVRT